MVLVLLLMVIGLVMVIGSLGGIFANLSLGGGIAIAGIAIASAIIYVLRKKK